MGIPARALLREKGTPYAELGLADPKWSDDQLIDFMLAHPILINRPIVVTPKGVGFAGRRKRCWSCSTIPIVSFVKEDGEVVTRAKSKRGRVGKAQRAHHISLASNGGHGASAPSPTPRYSTRKLFHRAALRGIMTLMELTPRLRLMNWLVRQGLKVCRKTICSAASASAAGPGGLDCRAASSSSIRCTRFRGPRLSLERHRNQRERQFRVRLVRCRRGGAELAALHLLPHARTRP